MKYKLLVGVDRDHTINSFSGKNFGSKDNWKDNIEFCYNAIEGLKMLGQFDDIAIVVVTAQVGVAKGVMTEGRVRKVNSTMDFMLRSNGINIHSWQYSPYVEQNLVSRWDALGEISTLKKEYVLNKYDNRFNLIKPGDGLLKRAAKELGIEYSNIVKYVIGDSSSDAMCGFNGGGKGILIDNIGLRNRHSLMGKDGNIQDKLNQPKYQGRLFVVSDLVDAANIVIEDYMGLSNK